MDFQEQIEKLNQEIDSLRTKNRSLSDFIDSADIPNLKKKSQLADSLIKDYTRLVAQLKEELKSVKTLKREYQIWVNEQKNTLKFRRKELENLLK